MLFFSSDDLLFGVKVFGLVLIFLIHQGRPFFILPGVIQAAGQKSSQSSQKRKSRMIKSNFELRQTRKKSEIQSCPLLSQGQALRRQASSTI
jgi:hypothetical protein